jgi:O-antigen/teichoic acid export membrane protein
VGLECLAQAVAFTGAIWLFRRKIGLAVIRPTWSRVMDLVRATWNFFLVSIVQTLFNSVDMLMLSVISGDLFAGFYAASLKLIGAFELLPQSFTGAFLPVLSRTALSDPDEFHRRFTAYFRFVFWMGVGLGAVFYALAEDLVVFLFGEEFRPAGHTLQLLAVALVLTFANWPLSTAIISLNKERLILRAFAICTVFNVLTNLWFIPRFMDQGAAWTTIYSNFFFLILQCRILGPSFRQTVGLARLTAGFLAVGLFSYGVLALFSFWNIGWIGKLVAFGPVFMFFSLVSRVIRLDELYQGFQFLFRKSAPETATGD